MKTSTVNRRCDLSLCTSSLSFRFLQAFSSVTSRTDCTFNLQLLANAPPLFYSRCVVRCLNYSSRTCVVEFIEEEYQSGCFIVCIYSPSIRTAAQYQFSSTYQPPSINISMTSKKNAKLASQFRWKRMRMDEATHTHTLKSGILNIKYHTMHRRNSDIYFHFLGSHKKQQQQQQMK